MLQGNDSLTTHNLVDVLQLGIDCERVSISKVVVRLMLERVRLLQLGVGPAGGVCEKYMKLMAGVKAEHKQLDPGIMRAIVLLYETNKTNAAFLTTLGHSIVHFG